MTLNEEGKKWLIIEKIHRQTLIKCEESLCFLFDFNIRSDPVFEQGPKIEGRIPFRFFCSIPTRCIFLDNNNYVRSKLIYQLSVTIVLP